MIILALDLGKHTGWALGDPTHSLPIFGEETFDAKRGESPGVRYLRLRRFLDEIHRLAGPIALLVREEAHHRGGAATEQAIGYATHSQSWAAENGAETAHVHTGTLKKLATGRGNAGKPAVLAAARDRWGPGVKTDNQADALWVLEWARQEFGKTGSSER